MLTTKNDPKRNPDVLALLDLVPSHWLDCGITVTQCAYLMPLLAGQTPRDVALYYGVSEQAVHKGLTAMRGLLGLEGVPLDYFKLLATREHFPDQSLPVGRINLARRGELAGQLSSGRES